MADLSGANLEGANLTGADLEGPKANEDTTWPEGFRRLNERLCVWRSRRCEPKL